LEMSTSPIAAARAADRHDMVEPEALLELVDLRGQGFRIGGVAVKRFGGDRAAVRGAWQAVDDLQCAAAAAAAVAAPGQRAVAAFHVARRDVVKHQRAIGRMTLVPTMASGYSYCRADCAWLRSPSLISSRPYGSARRCIGKAISTVAPEKARVR